MWSSAASLSWSSVGHWPSTVLLWTAGSLRTERGISLGPPKCIWLRSPCPLRPSLQLCTGSLWPRGAHGSAHVASCTASHRSVPGLCASLEGLLPASAPPNFTEPLLSQECSWEAQPLLSTGRGAIPAPPCVCLSVCMCVCAPVCFPQTEEPQGLPRTLCLGCIASHLMMPFLGFWDRCGSGQLSHLTHGAPGGGGVPRCPAPRGQVRTPHPASWCLQAHPSLTACTWAESEG